MSLLQSAADQGHFGAITNLGILYAHGSNEGGGGGGGGYTLAKDEAMAVKLLTRAATGGPSGGGVAQAQCVLGLMHRDGRGVPQDAAAARTFLAMGAEQVRALAWPWAPTR